MKKFDYLVVETLVPMSLDILKLKGEMGWEMCGCTQLKKSDVSEYVYYFKKEIV